MKLLTLTQAESKEPIYVNFDQVQTFEELSKSTVIDFYNNSVEVAERASEIMEMLEHLNSSAVIPPAQE